MLSLKSSDEIAYNGSNNCARMDLFADTAADLTGVTTFDSIVLLAGSSVLDISTGDLYRMQSDGTWVLQPGTGAFSNVYTKAEIDAMIANYYTKSESDDLYEWITATITTDTLPLAFIADGTPLISWSIKGNGSQTGTPTPDNPIHPEFVGTLDDSDWTIPITCAEQTMTVNLSQVRTVRKIWKRVLDGTESITSISSDYWGFTFNISSIPWGHTISTTGGFISGSGGGKLWFLKSRFSDYPTAESLQQFFADEYAAGHPVTVWYILSSAHIRIVNEPLCKIGDYADELSSEDAGVTIPTVRGSNTLTVNTTLQPSEITITGKIRES